MSSNQLESTLWVPAPIARVWDFFSDPKNLAALTPALFSLEVDAPEGTVNGAKVGISMSPFGLTRIEWVSRLEDVVADGANRQFVDVQEKGPFASWRHEHIFESGSATLQGDRSGAPAIPLREPGTWLRDRVSYELPFGPLGEVADRLIVHRQLEKLFAYRTVEIRKRFGVG